MRVFADQVSIGGGALRRFHPNSAGSADHVTVGEDQSIGREREPRPGAAMPSLL